MSLTSASASQDLSSQVSDFGAYLDTQKAFVEEALIACFETPLEAVEEAACYSLLSASKRLRPILCLETCKALMGSYEPSLQAALAVEMVHTYSLIHDDLPAMDDDDLRRGKPTSHKKYGEARAILAGDGLLTKAFEVLCRDDSVDPKVQIKWAQSLSQAAGMRGMVLGQDIDMQDSLEASEAALEKLHRAKTGALIACSVEMGAIAAGADSQTIEKLRGFASDLGLAFQIHDDVLDVEGGAEMGKPANSDERNKKLTYVGLLGRDGAKARGRHWYESALKKLSETRFSFENRLANLAEFVIARKV